MEKTKKLTKTKYLKRLLILLIAFIILFPIVGAIVTYAGEEDSYQIDVPIALSDEDIKSCSNFTDFVNKISATRINNYIAEYQNGNYTWSTNQYGDANFAWATDYKYTANTAVSFIENGKVVAQFEINSSEVNGGIKCGNYYIKEIGNRAIKHSDDKGFSEYDKWFQDYKQYNGSSSISNTVGERSVNLNDVEELKSIPANLYGMVETVFGGTMVKEATEAISEISLNDNNAIWVSVKGLYDSVMVPIGEVLLLIFLFINIYEEYVRKDEITVEGFIKNFIQFIIGYFFMKNGLVLVEGFVNGSDALLTTISSTMQQGDVSSGVDLASFRADLLKEYNGPISQFWTIGATLKLFLPWVIAWISSIIAKVVVWGRTIEIVVRVLFLPIGAADIYSGMHSPAVKYVKKILATALQAVVAIIILYATSAIAGSLTGEVVTNMESLANIGFINITGVRICGIALLLKSQQIANDIVL